MDKRSKEGNNPSSEKHHGSRKAHLGVSNKSKMTSFCENVAMITAAHAECGFGVGTLDTV